MVMLKKIYFKLCVMVLSKYYTANKSDNLKGSVFTNINKVKPKSLFDVIKWKIQGGHKEWNLNIISNINDTPPSQVHDSIRVSFIGQATFLVQMDGLNIITDPVYSNTIGPFNIIGPKRKTGIGIKWDSLPKIDIVLISHNHYDHLDLPTIKKLWYRDKPQIFTPLGNDAIIKCYDSNIESKALDWNDSLNYKDVKVSLAPAQHWSARGIFDKNKALWGTFILQSRSGSICFIGDSGYNDTIFKEISNQYGQMKLSIIPIGAYEPRWFMKDVHMNPDEAVLTHLDLKSEYSVASHFHTFQLTDENYNDPLIALELAKSKYKIEKFYALKVGAHQYFR